MFLNQSSLKYLEIPNLYCTISEELTGVRLNSWSGMKKPSSCPISSSRITPSANWTQNTQDVGAYPRKMTYYQWKPTISFWGCFYNPLVESDSAPSYCLFVCFTCLSISATCRPMDDIFWLTKCKMAYMGEMYPYVKEFELQVDLIRI